MVSSTDTPSLWFGCGGAWAKAWFDDRAAEALLQSAMDLGIRHFDTGPTYGAGVAETRLGAFIRRHGSRDSISISTKVGSHIGRGGGVVKDYSYKALRSSLQASLDRLGVDYVDLLLTHGPLTPAEFTPQLIDSMGRLREEGVALKIGASCDGQVAALVANEPTLDVLMTTVNYFDQTNIPASTRAAARGAVVIAKSPLARGIISFPRRPVTSRASLWQNARLLRRSPVPLAKATALKLRGRRLTVADLLRFVSEERSIGGIVVGTTNAVHLAETHRLLAEGEQP